MRHDPIPNRLFRDHRERLIRTLPGNALAIVQANDPIPWSTDGQGPYHPNDDLFWLTGIEQEDSLLLLYPDAIDPRQRCILFLREPSEILRIWEGDQLSKEQACAISGIDEIRWLRELPALLRIAMCEANEVFLPTNEHSRAVIHGQPRDLRFVHDMQRQYPLHQFRRLAQLLHPLRAVKGADEISQLKRACAITRDGFLRILGMVRPGVNEYEVEAEYAHEFLRQRAKMAYNPIIAAGANSCVLHYIRNDQPCRDGDVLLLDVAASYANYNADLTRTIPVNGRFSKRQRKVYDAVLRTVKAMTRAARPGVFHRDWQRQCEELITEELLTIGLLTSAQVKNQEPGNPAFRKYFMHGCGHHLGLGVHDLGRPHVPFAPGNVLTIEPGIYIPDEGFGIRIENDIVITRGNGGAQNLFADVPSEAEEIEDLMRKAQASGPSRTGRRLAQGTRSKRKK
jgi:Xaa-Pro aminopeptidase